MMLACYYVEGTCAKCEEDKPNLHLTPVRFRKRGGIVLLKNEFNDNEKRDGYVLLCPPCNRDR